MPGVIGPWRTAVASLAIVGTAATLTSRAQSPQPTSSVRPAFALPFSVTLGDPFSVDGVDEGLHSYVFGTIGDRVLIVGGRRAGLHGFSSDENPTNFGSENGFMWVIDLAARKAFKRFVTPAEPFLLGDVLSATNQQAAQDGDDLFVVGGYGLDSPSRRNKTFPSLTIINLPRAMDLVTNGDPNSPMLSAITRPPDDERFRVTGGALFQVNHRFFLLFGQVFDGMYTPAPKVTASFTQVYTESVRSFTYGGTPPAVTWLPSFPVAPALNHDMYHRRDFSAVLTLDASGADRLSVFGGAFRMGRPEAHLNVVDIDGLGDPMPMITVPPLTARTLSAPSPQPGASPAPAPPLAPHVQPNPNAFQQGLSQYSCPTVTIVGGAAAGDAFTIFFGGLSQFRYDAPLLQLIENEAMTDHGLDTVGFIDAISGVATRKDQTRQGFIIRAKMPGLMGTSAALIPRPGFENGRVDLGKLTAPTTVGYIFGGITATALHAGAAGTSASPLFIPVIVTPTASSADPMPLIPLLLPR